MPFGKHPSRRYGRASGKFTRDWMIENKVNQTQRLPNVVECAGLLGALERELDRRSVLASVSGDFGE